MATVVELVRTMARMSVAPIGDRQAKKVLNGVFQESSAAFKVALTVTTLMFFTQFSRAVEAANGSMHDDIFVSIARHDHFQVSQ